MVNWQFGNDNQMCPQPLSQRTQTTNPIFYTDTKIMNSFTDSIGAVKSYKNNTLSEFYSNNSSKNPVSWQLYYAKLQSVVKIIF